MLRGRTQPFGKSGGDDESISLATPLLCKLKRINIHFRLRSASAIPITIIIVLGVAAAPAAMLVGILFFYRRGNDVRAHFIICISEADLSSSEH